jgi:hypothetical protein
MWALLQLCGTEHVIKLVLRKLCNLVIRVNPPYIWSSRLFLSGPVNFGEKLKGHKSPPGIDQTPASLIKAGGRTIHSEIYKRIISFWNEEELPEEWKESIIVPIYEKNTKTDCSNYKGMSLLPIINKTLSNILLSRLTPYVDEIIGDHQFGFQVNYSTYILHLSNTSEKMGIQ